MRNRDNIDTAGGFWSRATLRLNTARKPEPSPKLKCEICGSADLNWLGDACRNCGASLSDPHGNYLEQASF